MGTVLQLTLSRLRQSAAPRTGTLAHQVKNMPIHMTRPKLIQIWFAAVAFVVIATVAFGAAVTVSTAAMLLALALVPPVLVLLLWPGIQPPTASEVIHGTDRRR
jgi:branched-subunit amino acid permease